jgi:XTP/dITP diphosphohydrolase
MKNSIFHTLIFASANQHKALEIRSAFRGSSQIMLPADLGFLFEVEETGNTLLENAVLKAEAAWQLTGKPSFADDTGLFCDALEGAPGVHTARFAFMQGYQGSNIELLLEKLSTAELRDARFESVFCLRWAEGTAIFHGVLHGQISPNPKGTGGFGYDPVFVPQGFQKTLAELPREVKLLISHRSQALHAMHDWIEAKHLL